METNTQLEALNNAVVSMNLEGLEVRQYIQHDNRKKVSKFFLQQGAKTISPVLTYNEMNHFILGMMKMQRLTNNN